MRAGFVTIVGRPNAGKSTLLNQIKKDKLAIASDKAQTTRNLIRAIWTSDDAQIIFIDTPGIHKPQHELGRQLNRMAYASLEGVDLIYYLVDATKNFSQSDQRIVDVLKQQEMPIILILNKIDLIPKKELLEKLAFYDNLQLFDELIPVSAKDNDNIERLIALTIEKMPESEAYFTDDHDLDYPEAFYITEFIREHILHSTNQEIPHSVAVSLDSFKENKKAILIQASIIAERDSQKGILIGKQGQKLKQIGTAAREVLSQRYQKPVFLDLFVKVEKNWRNTAKQLNELNHWSEDE